MIKINTLWKRPKKDIPWRRIATFGGGPPLALAVLLQLIFFPPSFLRVQQVEVKSTLAHLSELDLVRLSQVQKGDSLLTLSLSTVRERILRYPWIREVQLSKRFPGRLQIWAEERMPVALLEFENKELYLVSREGKVFKSLEKGDPKDLPMISGFLKQDLDVLSAQLKPLIRLILQFDGSDVLRPVGISELHWKGDNGISIFTKEPCIRLELGQQDPVSWGSLGLWEEGIERFARSWPKIQSASRKPKVVDLSLRHRIIVKQG